VSDPIVQPLFFALPVPAGVAAAAGRVQDELRRAAGSPRLPALADLHVTLAYLGRLDLASAPALLALAAAAGARHAPFPLRTGGLGGFPRLASARVLWLGFAPQPALDALVADLWAALAAAGVGFDGKPFQPHLTLARFREPVAVERVAPRAPEPLDFPVREFSLFQSLQLPAGNRYLRLGSIVLA
jgi:2'-5' RNA ligase